MYAGTTLNLTCDYTFIYGDRAVTWMVDGVAVDTSSGRISTDGDTLSFSPVATSDTGNYACTLTATVFWAPDIIQSVTHSEVESLIVEGIHTVLLVIIV